MWPPDDDLLAAWRRLVTDPDSAGTFAEVVLPPLIADLTHQFRDADPDHVTEAADVAVLAFLRRPAAYDPAKGRLPSFLRMAARRDLLNLLKAEGRHHRRRIPWDGVELAHPGGNEPGEDGSLDDHPAIGTVVAAMTELERRVFDLMRDGERATAVFAAVMGITDRPADEQADEVLRVKDRIMARLKRAGRGL